MPNFEPDEESKARERIAKDAFILAFNNRPENITRRAEGANFRGRFTVTADGAGVDLPTQASRIAKEAVVVYRDNGVVITEAQYKVHEKVFNNKGIVFQKNSVKWQKDNMRAVQEAVALRTYVEVEG